MFVNIKIGLFSMVLILLFTTICLIQLGNDERTNWKPGQNIMTYFFIVWLLFYILEILNPNNVMAAWNINLTPYALTPLICAFVVPIVIRTKKDIELLLIIWSIFVLIFTLKGYWQKNHGFSSKDLYFLHVVGGARTHIPDGNASTSFLLLFAAFMEWESPEHALPWAFLWVAC